MNLMIAEMSGLDNYRNFMTEPHRRFHDRIVADLNGILPICNQGKCTAADISTNVTEQQQITDLMQKVEHLCVHLSESVTDLFAQYYRERGRFCGAAFCTTALIKVNLVDRSLRDRATDIRWWAKDPELLANLFALKKIGRQLEHDMTELTAYMEASVTTFRIPTLASGWKSVDLAQAAHDIEAFFPRKRELMFNAVVRQQFSRQISSMSDMLKIGEGQEATTKHMSKLLRKLESCEQHVKACCDQLEIIANVYPTLNDLVLVDDDGFVIANADGEKRESILGSNVSREGWHARALGASKNQSGLEQDTANTQSDRLVVFAEPMRHPDDRTAAAIGVLGVYCNLQAEVQSLLEDYMPRDSDGEIRDGWFSFFTDEEGVVVCSSDPGVVVPGTPCELPRNHRRLQSGTASWSYAIFKGKECLAFSSRSDGGQGVSSNGWISHVVAPACEILQPESRDSRLEISQRHLMRSQLVPEINKSTYASLQDDRQAIKLISLNGILFASQLGKRGAALAPVFDKITATGDSATSRMESMLHEMASSEIELNLHSLETLSKQAADLISQKVQDRGQALRLWSRNRQLQAALVDQDEDSLSKCESILKMINDDYPVYRNILFLNSCGDTIARSRTNKALDSENRCFADSPWFRNALRNAETNSVQVQETSEIESGGTGTSRIVFARAVLAGASGEGPLGVLACVFGWHSETSSILQSCLPQSANGRPIANSVAFFTNSEGVVLDSTLLEVTPSGRTFPLPEEHFAVQPGKTLASVFHHDNVSYILASSKMAVRPGLGNVCWSAHVMRPMN